MRTPASRPYVTWDADSARAKSVLAGLWLPFALVNAVVIYQVPGVETIPYHLIWASFALFYGLAVWPKLWTRSIFVAITVVTAVPLIQNAAAGVIAQEEVSEIVLMAVIIGLLMWHVDRGRVAQRVVADLHESDRIRSEQRELATRFGSHELRTRLSIARGFIELVRDTTSDRSSIADCNRSIAELDKATSLSKNLMTFVRMDGALTIDELDLDELIADVVSRWAARESRRWVISGAAGTICANPERLEAVLDCLLENAVKFTSTGQQIRVHSTGRGDDLLLRVIDFGIGIPPEDLDKVTDLFHRSQNVDGREGNGIGLAIVRSAAEARGGSVAIESRLGGGTAVTITLPNCRVHEVSHTRLATEPAPAPTELAHTASYPDPVH